MTRTQLYALLIERLKHRPFERSIVEKLFQDDADLRVGKGTVNVTCYLDASAFDRSIEKMRRLVDVARSGYPAFLRSYGLAPAPGSRWKNTFTFDTAEVVTIDDDHVTFAYVDFNTGKLGDWLKRPVNAFLRDFEYQRVVGMSPALGAGYGGPTLRDCVQKFHSGGVVGLRPGEVPAILARGEEVIPTPIKVGSLWKHRNSGKSLFVLGYDTKKVKFVMESGLHSEAKEEKFRRLCMHVRD